MENAIEYAVVTGGAGFLASHLCEKLVRRGCHVLCVDDLSSGSVENTGTCEEPGCGS
ncbi:NAD-dependent epimerase/dehydratase family protein [Sciscionella sediminilitoris]|uniref:NAD-dependent epimerase/dehydratase family protein n=1 Tax=Sciscionella sediminilitoris TaxID=1445613 RepID=UPI0012E2FAF0|nr:NAD-dependent epimerase/dehydratase family protein [Sciscionella sp. SE31]